MIGHEKVEQIAETLPTLRPDGLYIANSLWWMHSHQSGPFRGVFGTHKLEQIRTLANLARTNYTRSHVLWGLYGAYKEAYSTVARCVPHCPPHFSNKRAHLRLVDELVKKSFLGRVLPIEQLLLSGGDYCTIPGKTGGDSRHWGHLGGIHYSFPVMATLLDVVFQNFCQA